MLQSTDNVLILPCATILTFPPCSLSCVRFSLDSSNPGAADFEALCRAHIAAFAKGAERYKAETNLTKRVGDWQAKLAPKLEDEAQRPEFDIHVYGKEVITSLLQHSSNKGKHNNNKATTVVPFNAIVKTKQPYDVCRIFLASLSLSNSHNVLFKGSPEGTVSDKLQLELLNPDIALPTFTRMANDDEEQ